MFTTSFPVSGVHFVEHKQSTNSNDCATTTATINDSHLQDMGNAINYGSLRFRLLDHFNCVLSYFSLGASSLRLERRSLHPVPWYQWRHLDLSQCDIVTKNNRKPHDGCSLIATITVFWITQFSVRTNHTFTRVYSIRTRRNQQWAAGKQDTNKILVFPNEIQF